MNTLPPIPSIGRLGQPVTLITGSAMPSDAAGTSRLLRNTYALLSMTLLAGAAVAAAGVASPLPAPGFLLTLGSNLGLHSDHAAEARMATATSPG